MGGREHFRRLWISYNIKSTVNIQACLREREGREYLLVPSPCKLGEEKTASEPYIYTQNPGICGQSIEKLRPYQNKRIY